MPEAPVKVLADTSFFIRLLKENDPLHSNAKGYFKYLRDHSGIILCSTIAMAEYCVKGQVEELPLKAVQVVPFNATHAIRAGEFARMSFAARVRVDERVIIPNDCKLLAQADVEQVGYYLTSDSRSRTIFEVLRTGLGLSFQFIDIRDAVNETFGILDFPEE
ncbi:MAG TPA: PIN domain-containing protein [Candidatus Kapabacteria bacterium]|jgi:predicted nucleic acid-binding protein